MPVSWHCPLTNTKSFWQTILVGRTGFISLDCLPSKDFPYVLPGPADHWGGTSYTAGIRTHVLNILFGMKEVPETDSWKLIIDLLDTHHEFPALFKITINGNHGNMPFPKEVEINRR